MNPATFHFSQFIDRSNLPPLEEYTSDRYRPTYSFTTDNFPPPAPVPTGYAAPPQALQHPLHHPSSGMTTYRVELDMTQCIDDDQSNGVVTSIVPTISEIWGACPRML